MTQTHCPECRLTLDQPAAACPHCGYPLELAANPAAPAVSTAAPVPAPGPPLLPVILGGATMLYACIAGWFFLSFALLLGEAVVLAEQLEAGMAGLAAVFTLLHIPAGFGILLHKTWGKKLAQGLTFGTVIAVALWYAALAVNSGNLLPGGGPEGTRFGMICLCVLALLVPIGVNFALNSRPLQVHFPSTTKR